MSESEDPSLYAHDPPLPAIALAHVALDDVYVLESLSGGISIVA